MEPRADDIALSLRPVAEHLGLPAARTLVKTFPGVKLQVPRTWREDLMLNRAGDALAQNLCCHFGGEQIPVPVHLLTMEARHRLVRVLAERGWIAALIALESGFTQRQVQRILNSGPIRPRLRGRVVDPRQIDLLDFDAG